jgi:hypothetical protein
MEDGMSATTGKTFLGAVILTLLCGTLAAIAEDETADAKISDGGWGHWTRSGWLENYVKWELAPGNEATKGMNFPR